jgi:hypothetical protein
MRLLVEGLAWARRWQGRWQVSHKSSITRARARLGPAPLRELFAEVVRPLPTSKTKGAWYRGWRLVALDGTTLDVPDTPANVAAFGRPTGGRGQGSFPQVRLVGLVECGTHAGRGRGHGWAAPGRGLTGTLAGSLAEAGDAAAGRPGPVRPGAVAHLPPLRLKRPASPDRQASAGSSPFFSRRRRLVSLLCIGPREPSSRGCSADYGLWGINLAPSWRRFTGRG